MHKNPTDTAATSGRQLPALLTIEEARAALRVSRWSLYKLINERRLKTIKIGQRRLIPADDLHQFIDDLRQEEASYGR